VLSQSGAIEQSTSVTVGASNPSTARDRRPDLQLGALMVALALGCVACLMLAPDASSTIEPGGWWAVPTVLIVFGIAEYTYFNVEFRKEGISFSMNEIPMAFALVFVTPLAAVLLRLPLSTPVLFAVRGNRGVKLMFNVTLFAFETSLAVLIFRLVIDAWGDAPYAVVAGVAFSLTVLGPVISTIISFAISRYDGRFSERVVSELHATWWMYPINSVLGAMTVALAIFEPALAFLAIVPAVSVWYVLKAHGELGQELRDLDAVHGFAGRVGRTLDVDEIGETAVAEIVAMLRAEAAALIRFTADGAVEHLAGEMPVHLPASATEPGWSEILARGEVQVIDEAQLRAAAIPVEPGVPEVLVAPLTDETGAFAVILVVRRDLQRLRFEKSDVARVKNVGEQLAVSLRRGMLHEQLEFEARHDALTGLPARTMFETEVGAAVHHRHEDEIACVLMLDLDRFKEVNDTLGHHAGDDLLVQFADRMSALLGHDDVMARLAGDEFAILCRRRTHDEIVEFARDCARVGSQPVTLDGLEIVVTVSVGVAEITALDTDAVQPMRRADIAMYNAKWQRSGVEHYRDEIDRRTPARLSMLGDLRAAIETNELDVVYQPKLDLASGLVVGAEALVRWDHPTRGVVAPSEFVRVAEDTGLIKELTDLVLARGIATLARLQANGMRLGLSVNLSTHDLFDGRLPDRVRGYLDRHGVFADSITLEITESSLLVDAPRTRATIDELHAVGLRLAIDDFGTGYSSLSYLRRLPVHELKIDQTFVAGMLDDPQDEVIVRSTIDLGHNLGLQVVAEGVESMAVLDRLAAFGCDVAQGYGIAAPMSVDQLIAWVARADAARLQIADQQRSPTAWVANLASVR
jgi:diguanylate cyclase (GGDEF)-like protein